MPKKKEKTLREHLLEISKKKTAKKAEASRRNGAKGGRPPLKPRATE